MSETTEKKRQPRTCFHIPDEVFQVLFKEARSRRITVTDYILDMLKRELKHSQIKASDFYHHSSAVERDYIKEIFND
ncbi:hypothetical protein KZA97_00140 [Escherichia coli]|nr:hypothetical protein [Escherichia coli]MBW8962266.1 hypothetical protein [Escherichia coli]